LLLESCCGESCGPAEVWATDNSATLLPEASAAVSTRSRTTGGRSELPTVALIEAE
jgi:hypothetical protein